MISKVKDKTAHTRNAYLQGYNNGLLATVNATYGGGNVIPLVTPPFGGRLLDRNGYYQVTDANFNVIGNVNVLDLEKNGVGTIDTATVDAAPGGTAAGYKFIPIGLATGNPIGVNGLDYIIRGSTALEYCGIARANSYVQSPTYNANGAYLTLGMVSAFMTRMQQALGTARLVCDGELMSPKESPPSRRARGFPVPREIPTKGEEHVRERTPPPAKSISQ